MENSGFELGLDILDGFGPKTTVLRILRPNRIQLGLDPMIGKEHANWLVFCDVSWNEHQQSGSIRSIHFKAQKTSNDWFLQIFFSNLDTVRFVGKTCSILVVASFHFWPLILTS